MKKIKFLFSLAIVALLTVSCNNNQEKTLFTTVMKTNKGDIRGVNLNSSPEQVKKIEGEKPDSVADGYLAYFIDVPSKQAHITVEYSFDNTGLYSADIKVKIDGDSTKSMAAIDTLQTKIRKLLTKKYGAPVELSPVTLMWNFKSESGSSASTQLLNNSEVEGTGYLEILVQTEVE